VCVRQSQQAEKYLVSTDRMHVAACIIRATITALIAAAIAQLQHNTWQG
jgi:hypothetical protein